MTLPACACPMNGKCDTAIPPSCVCLPSTGGSHTVASGSRAATGQDCGPQYMHDHEHACTCWLCTHTHTAKERSQGPTLPPPENVISYTWFPYKARQLLDQWGSLVLTHTCQLIHRSVRPSAASPAKQPSRGIMSYMFSKSCRLYVCMYHWKFSGANGLTDLYA